jgi:hypothetical protein
MEESVTIEVMVFSTSVETQEQVEMLAPYLNSLFGKKQWNFALDDADRILRIISNEVDSWAAIRLLNERGFECKELDN